MRVRTRDGGRLAALKAAWRARHGRDLDIPKRHSYALRRVRRSLAACTVAALLVLVAPPSQSAELPVFYGGGPLPKADRAVPMTLTRAGDSVRALLALTVRCRRVDVPITVVRAKGAVTGDAFTARGTVRITTVRGLRVRVALDGSLSPTAASGTLELILVRGRGGPRGCDRPIKQRFELRATSELGGEPSQPAAGAGFWGILKQIYDGFEMPVAVAVTDDAKRAYGVWMVMAHCPGPEPMPIWNYSPPALIGADGRFRKSERFKLRYGDGTTDHHRVVFQGRFTSEGVSGTVRARVRTTNRRGRTLFACDSGEQTFTARP